MITKDKADESSSHSTSTNKFYGKFPEYDTDPSILIFPPVTSQLRHLTHKLVDTFYCPQFCSFSIGQDDDRRVIVGSTSRITKCSLPYACVHEKLFSNSKVLEKLADCICSQRIKLLLVQDSDFAIFMSAYENSHKVLENNDAHRRILRMKEENKAPFRDRLKRPDKQLYVPRALRKTVVENVTEKKDDVKAIKKLRNGQTSIKFSQTSTVFKGLLENQRQGKKKEDKTHCPCLGDISDTKQNNISIIKTNIDVTYVEESAVDTVKNSPVDNVKDSLVDNAEDSLVDDVKDFPIENVKDSLADHVKNFLVDNVKDSPIDSIKDPPVDIVKDSPVDNVKDSPVDNTKGTSVDIVKNSPVDSTDYFPIDNADDSSVNIPNITFEQGESSKEIKLCSVIMENGMLNMDAVNELTGFSDDKILSLHHTDGINSETLNGSKTSLQNSDTTNAVVHGNLEKDFQCVGAPQVEDSLQTNVSSINPEDSWETMFNDEGDCLDPKFVKELCDITGRIELTVAKSDYSGYQPVSKSASEEYDNIVELFGFPVEFSTQDLTSAFSVFQEASYNIKWVDDTHALAIFSSPVIGMFEAHKPRPVTSAVLARRLVSGALGLKLNASKEQRDIERNILREAREKKKLKAKQRQDIWNGIVS